MALVRTMYENYQFLGKLWSIGLLFNWQKNTLEFSTSRVWDQKKYSFLLSITISGIAQNEHRKWSTAR